MPAKSSANKYTPLRENKAAEQEEAKETKYITWGLETFYLFV